MPTKTEKAYLFLRRKILDLAVAPGSPLRIGQLQERLAMTRAPVLDALIWLQAEDYLQNDHNQVFYVKNWSAEEIRQTYEVRAIFAEHAAACWAQRKAEASLDALRVAIDGADKPTGSFDPEAVLLSLRSFDQAMLDADSTSLIATLSRKITPPAQFRRTVRMFNREDFAEALLTRRRLLEAIEHGDAAWAKSLAKAAMLFLQHRHLSGLEATQGRSVDDWLTADDLPPIKPDVVWGEGRPDLENSTLATLRPRAF